MTDAKALVEEFCTLCAQLSMDYDLYYSLFEVDKQRLDFYSDLAPLFFGDINRILIEQLIMQTCKITDPAKTGRNYNLTKNYVVEEISWPDAVRDELRQINTRLMSFRKYVEPARSKRIAHIDLHAQIGIRENLGGFPVCDVEPA